MRKVRVISGPAAGRELELEQEIVVGRENADFVIPDEEMSRRHAALRPVAQGVEIEDLDSLNGTYVDGQRISEPRTIGIRSVVKIGGSELSIDVSLPPAEGLPATVGARLEGIADAQELAVTVAGAVPTGPGPATPLVEEPPGVSEQQSRVEHPHLPYAASIAIYAAAIVAVVVLLVVSRYYV